MDRFFKQAGKELEKVARDNQGLLLSIANHSKLTESVENILEIARKEPTEISKAISDVKEHSDIAKPVSDANDMIKPKSLNRQLEIIGKQYIVDVVRGALDKSTKTNCADEVSQQVGESPDTGQGEPIATNTLPDAGNAGEMDELKGKLHNLFQQGRVPFNVRTLAVCGYRSAGKTTLLRRLLNEPFREDEPITDGIRIGQIDVQNWKEKIDNPSDDLTTAIATCVLNTNKQSLNGTNTDQSTTPSNEEPKTIGEDAVLSESFANEILMKMKGSSEDTEGFSVFRYYDFGGHVEYQQMHMPFLPHNAVYILVVNLNLAMNDSLPAKERPLRGQKVMDTCGYTVKDYLDYWIGCISSLSKGHKTTYRVMLVGTFAKSCSNADEALSNIYSYLQENFPPAALYAEKFAVDNSVDSDEGTGYTELRSAVDKLSMQVAFEDNVVVGHAKLYYHILQSTEKYLLCMEKYLPWYEIMGRSQGSEGSDTDRKLQVQAALQVLNCMKFAYFSDPILILDPQWLIDLMAALIPISCAPPLKIQTAPFPIQHQWMKLVNTGQFSESLLEYIWPSEILKLKDELLDIMKNLNLVVLADPVSNCYHLWFKRKQREVFLGLHENQAMAAFRKDIFTELIPLFLKEWPYIETLDTTFVRLQKKKNTDYKVCLELKNDRVLLLNNNEFEHDDFVYKVGSIVKSMQKDYPTLCLFVDGKPYKAVELFLQIRNNIKQKTEMVCVVKIFMEDQPEKQKDIFFRDQSIDIRFDTATEHMVEKIEERMLIKTLAEFNWFHGPTAEEICKKRLEFLSAARCFAKGKQLVNELCELLRKLHSNDVEARTVGEKVGEILQCCVIQCMLDTAAQPIDHRDIQTLDTYQLFQQAQPTVPESAIRDVQNLQRLSDDSTMSEDLIEKFTISIHRLFWIVMLVFVKCIDEKTSQEKSLEERISNLYFKTYHQFIEHEKALDALRNEVHNLTTAINSTSKNKSCKDWLHKNFSQFVQTMGEGVHNPVVDKLYEKHLNEEEVNNISSRRTSQEKNRELLRVMLDKGEDTCRMFLRLFCSKDPFNEITRKIQAEVNLERSAEEMDYAYYSMNS
ncbi:uncharacterized protein LOC116980846 [Amblyraja radiata]|uniref:uncharacterized protein LOC116980846 n=1 Tax=Amblyraja radiata TaxID=386614 RepID=UPI001402FD24|nr:uncharacterized protein LOC116980846 [Amblyraja radiata]